MCRNWIIIISLSIIIAVILSVLIIKFGKFKLIRAVITNNWFLFFLLVLLLGFDIYSRLPICITNESIVLTFIGILATFVVISNYAQVKEAEKKAEKHKREIDNEMNNLYCQLNMKYGYVFEGLYRNIGIIFLFQACDYYVKSLEYCNNEQERKFADKNINDCLANIRNDRIKEFSCVSHKIDCRRIMEYVSKKGYEVSDILEMVERTPVKNNEENQA